MIALTTMYYLLPMITQDVIDTRIEINPMTYPFEITDDAYIIRNDSQTLIMNSTLMHILYSTFNPNVGIKNITYNPTKFIDYFKTFELSSTSCLSYEILRGNSTPMSKPWKVGKTCGDRCILPTYCP